MPVPGTAAPGPCKASAARVYGHWLGGRDSSAADRDLAARMTDPGQGGYPGLADLARENRRFILAAVQRLAGIDGISQYLDLGCGIPPGTAVHEVACGAIPGARVAYVDNDPIVLSHAARLAGDGIAVTGGDLADPEAVTGAAVRAGALDLSQPAAVLLGAVLHYWPAEAAREIVAGYAGLLAPRSAVVISLAFFGNGAMDELRRRLPSVRFFNHGPQAVASFFAAAGLGLAGGRVAPLEHWPMLAREPWQGERQAWIIGGIGFKRSPPRA